MKCIFTTKIHFKVPSNNDRKQLIEMIEGSERYIIGERPMKELIKLFPYFTKQNKKKEKETRN
jgi:hypothetical protein